MSAGIAVNRPQQPGSLTLFQHKEDVKPHTSKQCPPQLDTAKKMSPPAQTPIEDNLDHRLRLALRDRDEQWKQHEKAQIAFLQQESSAMLKGLHSEIERLGHNLRDAKRHIFVTGGESISVCDHTEIDRKMIEQEETIRQLEEIIHDKTNQADKIERKVIVTIDKLQEQINLQADRIRQLTTELNDRNMTVAQLSSQLRSFRLRDAMATAQQRRRASQGGSGDSPLVSPSSPHRVFPPKGGLVSASVVVSYPGSKSARMGESSSMDGPGSIERPPRRRSSSGFGFSK